MMLFAVTLDRERFLAWIGGKTEPRPDQVSVGSLTDIPKGGVALLWKNKPLSTELGASQPIIVVRRSDLREFYAFVGTYVSTYKPFSAFFRVLLNDEVDEVLNEYNRFQMQNAFVGVIMAEAKLHGGEQIKKLADLNVQSCLATMSRTAVEGLLRNPLGSSLDQSLERWALVRSKLTGAQLRVESGRIRQFWNIVAMAHRFAATTVPADRTDTLIADFLSEVLELGDDADPLSWTTLTSKLKVVQRALGSMSLSREERVGAIDDAIADIKLAEDVDVRIREAAIGYLASRLASGSMSYLSLLDGLEDKLPLGVLWFGLFLSLRGDTDVMAAADCLGRRLARDIQRTWQPFEPPTADISFDEFDSLMREARAGIPIKTEYQSAVTVEIRPGQHGLFRIPREANRPVEDRGPQIAQEALVEIRELAARMSNIVSSALYNDRQRDLFSTDRLDRPQPGKSKRSRREG